MIPLHYLHTGPPSCACLPHCPLRCFSMEVVITKANISCSSCFYLPYPPLPFDFFLLLLAKTCLASLLPDGDMVDGVPTLMTVPMWLTMNVSTALEVLCQIFFGNQLMCNKGTMWYPRSWVKDSFSATTGKCLMYHCCMCCTIHVGLTACDQRDAPSHMAFFITNNALSLWLSSSSPTGTTVFIKGDSLLGHIFSNVFFSQPFPKPLSGKRHS